MRSIRRQEPEPHPEPALPPRHRLYRPPPRAGGSVPIPCQPPTPVRDNPRITVHFTPTSGSPGRNGRGLVRHHREASHPPRQLVLRQRTDNQNLADHHRLEPATLSRAWEGVSGMTPPAAAIMQVLADQMTAKYLFVGADLGVFEALADGVLDRDQLQERLIIPGHSL